MGDARLTGERAGLDQSGGSGATNMIVPWPGAAGRPCHLQTVTLLGVPAQRLHHGSVHCLTIHDEVVAVSQVRVPDHRALLRGFAPATREQNTSRPTGPCETRSGRAYPECEAATLLY
ncbi:MAG: hypothetical protein WBL53_02080 [Pseudonocardiaceae bacterium]